MICTMKTLFQSTVVLFLLASFALTGCDDDSSSSSDLLDPRDMIIEVKSPYDVMPTVEKIKTNIAKLKSQGLSWGLAHGHEASFTDVLNKGWGGAAFDSIYAIEICNPIYAGDILSDSTARFAATMMPCIISVYEKVVGADTLTYVSYMNARLMGEVFQDFPTIRKMMGGKIADDQDKILDFLPLPQKDWGTSLPGLNKGEMVLDRKSLYNNIDTTVAKIKEAVEASDWVFFENRDPESLTNTVKTKLQNIINDPNSCCKALAQQKLDRFKNLSEVRLIEICNKDYSRQILHDSKNRFVATLLPCTIAVYEKGDEVWIARMNTKRLGQVWGGTIEDVMGDLVTGDVGQILVSK